MRFTCIFCLQGSIYSGCYTPFTPVSSCGSVDDVRNNEPPDYVKELATNGMYKTLITAIFIKFPWPVFIANIFLIRSFSSLPPPLSPSCVLLGRRGIKGTRIFYWDALNNTAEKYKSLK